MNSNIRDFIKAIQNANKTATSAYDTAARVTRVEGSTAWVHVEGGVEETPVEMSISCEPGDDVRVRINKGAAYIIGNNTNPPTNDKAAVQQVMNISQIARQTATKAYEYLQSLFDELSKYVAKGTSNIGILSEVMKKTGDGVEIYKNDTDNNVYVQIHDSDVDVIQKAGNRAQKIFKAGVNNNQPFISAFSNDNTNPGIYSSAIGYGAVASGYNAHAEGAGIASEAFAHAEGYNGNEASATGAHAEGGSNAAFGPFSHAEGLSSLAVNTASHSEGGSTRAYNFYAHAEGGYTKAFGGYAHAEGNSSVSVAESSHSEGYNTKAYGSCSHAEGQSTTTGTGQQATATVQSTGDGSQKIYYAATAEGIAVKINGSTVSSSNYTKKGTRITFKNPPANGDQIVIESTGYSAGYVGTGAHAEGISSIAKADASHAEGYGTTVEGAYSHVEGRNAQISSSAYSAHAEGEGTKVLSGQGAHAEGRYTEANNAGAHAEGENTKAYGTGSHAEGNNTEANGDYSHAGGMNTVAGQYAQTVIGKYNDNQTDTLFEVGNGSSDARSNAFDVTYSGYIRTGKGYEKIAFGKNGNGEYGYWIPATQSEPETFVPWITSPGPTYTAGTNIDITNNVISAPNVAPVVNGKVPEQYLPSYVDDVIEGYYNPTDGKFYEESTFQTEIAGERGKIYISLDTDKSYRWSGTVFVELTSGGVVYSAGSGIDISATNEISADNTIARMTDLSGYLPLTGGTMAGAINSQNIVPATDDSYRLGSSTSKYNSAYLKRIYNLASIESTTDGSKRLLVPAKSGTIAVNEDLPNVVGNLIAVNPVLTSGTLIANVTISGVSTNIYAPSGGSSYTAGDGIDISNDEISVDSTIARVSAIPDELADLSDDSTHRLVTDTEKSAWNGKSDFSGSYNDLTDKPTIPAAQVNSDWNASSGIAQILNKPTLANVATSGSYNDLTDKPTIPAAQVNSDWNASSGVAQILNKPTIPSVPVTIQNGGTGGTTVAAARANLDVLKSVAYSGYYPSSQTAGWYTIFEFPVRTMTLAILQIISEEYENSSAIVFINGRYAQQGTSWANQSPEVTLFGNVDYGTAGGYTKFRITQNGANGRLALDIYANGRGANLRIKVLYCDVTDYNVYSTLTPAVYSTVLREVQRNFLDSIETTGNLSLRDSIYMRGYTRAGAYVHTGSTPKNAESWSEFLDNSGIDADEGINICQGINETSGIHMDGSTIVMWSPCDDGALWYYDEDGGDVIFHIDDNGNYYDSSGNKISPQVNSDWNATSGVAKILNKPALATVATSGSYNDLSNKPTIPAEQVNSDWNATSGVARILNKPTIPDISTKVSKSGDTMNGGLKWFDNNSYITCNTTNGHRQMVVSCLNDKHNDEILLESGAGAYIRTYYDSTKTRITGANIYSSFNSYVTGNGNIDLTAIKGSCGTVTGGGSAVVYIPKTNIMLLAFLSCQSAGFFAVRMINRKTDGTVVSTNLATSGTSRCNVTLNTNSTNYWSINVTSTGSSYPITYNIIPFGAGGS